MQIKSKIKTSLYLCFVLLMVGCVHSLKKNPSQKKIADFLKSFPFKQVDKKVLHHLEQAADDPMKLFDLVGFKFLFESHPDFKIYRAFFFSQFPFDNLEKTKQLSALLLKYMEQAPNRFVFRQKKPPQTLPVIQPDHGQKTKSLALKQDNLKTAFSYPQKPNRRVSSIDKKRQEEEKQFLFHAIDEIHSHLRFAVFMSDYYLACLEGNEEWFKDIYKKTDGLTYPDPKFHGIDDELKKRKTLIFARRTCNMRINNIKQEIKGKYPKMRTWLILYHYRNIGGEETRLSRGATESMEDWEWREKRALNHYHNNKYLMKHPLDGLVKLPPMSIEEVIEAEKVYDKNQAAHIEYLKTGEIPEIYQEDEDVKCFEKSPHKTGCYQEQYTKLLIGDSGNNIEGLPLLGFVTSPQPTDEEIIQGILSIRERTLETLNDFRAKYMVVDAEGKYQIRKWRTWRQEPRPLKKQISFILEDNLDIFKFAGLLIKTSFKFEHLVEEGFQLYKESEMVKSLVTIGVTISWSVGCMVLFRSPMAKLLCELPLGVGANVYFLAIDSAHYREAMRVAFYRIDGKTYKYRDISELSDLAFAKKLSLWMLPFFTGITPVIKSL